MDDRISNVLPDGWVALGFVGSIKCLDENGNDCFWNTRNGCSTWEAIGMLTALVDNLRDRLKSSTE